MLHTFPLEGPSSRRFTMGFKKKMLLAASWHAHAGRPAREMDPIFPS